MNSTSVSCLFEGWVAVFLNDQKMFAGNSDKAVRSRFCAKLKRNDFKLTW